MRGLVWGAETEEEDSWSKAVSLEGLAGASRSLRGHIKDGEPMKHFCPCRGIREGRMEVRLKEGRGGFSTMWWGRYESLVQCLSGSLLRYPQKPEASVSHLHISYPVLHAMRSFLNALFSPSLWPILYL